MDQEAVGSVFFAYPGTPELRGETIRGAAKTIGDRLAVPVKTWQELDVEGHLIIDQITIAIKKRLRSWRRLAASIAMSYSKLDMLYLYEKMCGWLLMRAIQQQRVDGGILVFCPEWDMSRMGEVPKRSIMHMQVDGLIYHIIPSGMTF
jgi:hypothetical protein